MGWWIALGIIVILAILPLGVDVRYDSRGFRASIAAGFLRIPLKPGKKEKAEKPKEEPQNTSQANSKPKEQPSSGSWKDFLPMVQIALDFLGELRRKIRINRLEMDLVMAGDDPCDLAVNYGRGNAALGNLIALLEHAFVIKKRDLKLQCDFMADQTRVTARAVITITLGRILSLAVRYGIRAVKEYFKINNLRKGGRVK